MNEPGRTDRVAVVTGSRAEFGLLAPVMRAVRAHLGLELRVIAAGSHFLGARPTCAEVERAFGIDAVVRMQDAGEARTRLGDAGSVGRGVSGFASAYEAISPACVVVLGDRIEAFAAAAAASVAGIPLAHIHGGDRAEGIADEAMRHAITKLSHLHFAATRESAERIVRMGEASERVYVVGSPAVDGLGLIPAMTDCDAAELGDPRAVLLLHPSGRANEEEQATARAVCEALGRVFDKRVVTLAPNHDAGREAIAKEIAEQAKRHGWRCVEHLPREVFVALLRRLSVREPATRGVLVGNSSAGLIEAAALRTMAVNVGDRQRGRERGGNVVQASGRDAEEIERVIRDAISRPGERVSAEHPFGDGNSGIAIADVLSRVDWSNPGLVRKCNTY